MKYELFRSTRGEEHQYWILSVVGRRRWAMRFATHAEARRVYDTLSVPAMLVKRGHEVPARLAAGSVRRNTSKEV